MTETQPTAKQIRDDLRQVERKITGVADQIKIVIDGNATTSGETGFPYLDHLGRLAARYDALLGLREILSVRLAAAHAAALSEAS